LQSTAAMSRRLVTSAANFLAMCATRGREIAECGAGGSAGATSIMQQHVMVDGHESIEPGGKRMPQKRNCSGFAETVLMKQKPPRIFSETKDLQAQKTPLSWYPLIRPQTTLLRRRRACKMAGGFPQSRNECQFPIRVRVRVDAANRVTESERRFDGSTQVSEGVADTPR
jgi:hypothetical protein